MLIHQLNWVRLYICFRNKTALAFITIALLIFSSCGKRGAPLPPVERVQQRAAISGFQQGNVINLSWIMPARNAGAGDTLNISRVDIYRLVEPTDAPLSLSEEEFSNRSTLIASVPVTESDFAKNRLTYTDNLEFAGQPARLRYAVRFVNKSGQKAAFSNFILIEPTAKIAENPTNLDATVTPEAIVLDWNPPKTNVDSSTPANILGYNLYRISEESAQPRLLNATPISDTNYLDRFFEYGKDYSYFVRTVSLGSDGNPIESLSSNTVEINPKDVFPPSPPSAITIAAAPNSISLFFATNPEKDVVGYRIYRTTNPELKKSEWENLTPEPIQTNTFQDAQVESGQIYYYYLTAEDKFGNISEPSEIVFEKVP